MSKILSITNQKGGVGKTTSCINLAAAITRHKQRVLLVDIDPQGNATMGSGINKHQQTWSLHHVLTENCDVRKAIQSSSSGGYHVLVGNSELTASEVNLMFLKEKEFRLKKALASIATDYDYILIDCPPSLNMLTINAMVASDGVIIPMQCEYYALEGLAALVETITKLKIKLNPNLAIEGLLRTMYDARLSLTNEVSRQLIKHFGKLVYRTVIPRNIRLAEAPSHGQSVIKYAQTSRGAIAYIALAGELVRKHKRKKATSVAKEKIERV